MATPMSTPSSARGTATRTKASSATKAPLAQALMGHKLGEKVNVPTEHGDRTRQIANIEAYKK